MCDLIGLGISTCGDPCAEGVLDGGGVWDGVYVLDGVCVTVGVGWWGVGVRRGRGAGGGTVGVGVCARVRWRESCLSGELAPECIGRGGAWILPMSVSECSPVGYSVAVLSVHTHVGT